MPSAVKLHALPGYVSCRALDLHERLHQDTCALLLLEWGWGRCGAGDPIHAQPPSARKSSRTLH
jgi:hypothetical protein